MEAYWYWICYLYLLCHWYPALVVHFTWLLCEMGGKCLYSCYFVKCCFQHLFKTICSLFVGGSNLAFSPGIVSKWCNNMILLTCLELRKCSILFNQRSDFHIVLNLSIAVSALPVCMLTLFSVDEILLPRHTNCSSNFRGLSFNNGMAPSWLMLGINDNELINHIHLWTHLQGHSIVGWPAKDEVHHQL